MNPNQIQATELLAKAGVSSPATRLMCEAIIKSNNDSAVSDLIANLNEMIAEKEAAYQEFKTKMATMAKEMLPARLNSAGVGGTATPAMTAPMTPVAPVSPETPPAEPVVDITPPGTMPPAEPVAPVSPAATPTL